jgi:hypothetical protein
VIDTAGREIEDCVAQVMAALDEHSSVSRLPP